MKMSLWFALMLFLGLTLASVYQVENVLECENMDEFSNGTYDEVEIIHCSNNNFTELTPNVFADRKCFNVTEAILRSNNIAYIHPDAFALMSKISYLDLYGNKLKALQKDSFRGLISLKILLLVDNQIESIEKGALESLSMLEKLDLSYNHITKLDKTFLKYSNVSELNLDNNPVVFPEHGTILESLTLIRLSLENCSLTNLPTNAFNKLLKLEYLNLSKNKLRVISRDLLKPLENLKVLEISYSLITLLEFSLPINLHTICCKGNDVEHGISCRNVSAIFHKANQDKSIDEKEINVENEVDHFRKTSVNDEVGRSTQKIQEDVTVEPVNVKTNNDQQTTLVVAVLVVSVVLAVFLLILMAQLYCLVKVIRKSAEIPPHINEADNLFLNLVT